MRRCVARGIGLTVCPAVSVKRELTEGTLKQIDCQKPEDNIPILMIWHIEKWCSPLLKRFMDLAKAFITN